MAQTAQVNIKVDSGDAQKNVNDLNSGISEAAKSAIPLKAQLKSVTQELQQMAMAGQQNTTRYRELTQQAGQLRDTMGDVAAEIATTAGSPVSSLGKGLGAAVKVGVNGFQAMVSGMALFGGESEELQKTMMKVQAAMAFTQSITALGDMGDEIGKLKSGFSAFAKGAMGGLQGIKGAIAATGIGLLVIAVGLLVAYWDDIKGAVSGVSSEQKKLNTLTTKQKELEENKLSTLKSSDNVLKLQGKSEKDILKLKIAQIGKVIDKSKLEIKNQIITNKAQEDAAQRNQDILTGVLQFILAPITMILKTIDLVSEGLAYFGAIDKKLNLADDVNRYMASFIFDPADTKAKGAATLKELTDGLAALENEAAGYQLALNDIEKGGGKTSVDTKVKVEDDKAKIEEDRRKKLVGDLEKQYNDELILARQGAVAKTNIMEDERLKQKTILQNQYNDFETDFLNKKIENEKAALDEAFTSNKITEAKYLKDLADLRKNAKTNLTPEEAKIIQDTQTKLNQDLLKIDEKSQEEIYQNKVDYQDKQIALMQDGMNKELAIRNAAYEKELKDFENLLKDKKITQDQYDKLVKDATTKVGIDTDIIKKKYSDQEIKADQEKYKKLSEQISLFGGAVLNLASSINAAFEQSAKNRSMQLEGEFQVESEALKSQLDNRLLTQAEYDAQVLGLQFAKDQELKKIQAKSFRRNKALNIAEAIQAGALAVLQALAAAPGPAGFILAAIAGTAAAVQIGTIAAQKFQAARGGIVPGSGPGNIDSVPSLLAPGEAVINSRSTAMFPKTLDMINQAGGGQALLPDAPQTNGGGQTQNVFSDNKPQAIRAYVVETEITNTQKRINRIQTSAEF